VILTLLSQGHFKAALELQRMPSFGSVEHASCSFEGYRSSPNGGALSKSIFEPESTVVSLSPPIFTAPHLSQLHVSMIFPPMDLDVLESIRHNRVEQKIAGISQQNQELLKAASAIHKRYEAKVSTALKDFRREITELEQQFSMRRVDEALHSSLVPAPSPLSTPAAGTLKSKQNGFRSKPSR
jgi:hypothetical protein